MLHAIRLYMQVGREVMVVYYESGASARYLVPPTAIGASVVVTYIDQYIETDLVFLTYTKGLGILELILCVLF